MGICRIGSATFWTASAVSLLLVVASTGRAQDAKAEDVVRATKNHFETVTPELGRYGRLTTYGETTSGTAIAKEALARERSLFNDALAAGLLKSPLREILALGHNLIVHDPTAGLAYLKALHASADLGNKDVAQAIVAATLASGEQGEAMAVSELTSKDRDRRSFWAHYLEYYAIFLASAEPIQKHLADESESAIKASLLRALSMIGSPNSLAVVKDAVERATDDDLQAAAIFSYTELGGYDGIAFLETIKPVGAQSSRERQESLSWLKAETRPDSKHGREVSNDSGFADRFGDLLSSPVIRWLKGRGLLEKDALKHSPRLDTDKKAELLDLLIDSRGFGLEAVKGSLYRNLSKEDEPRLLRIRAVSFYSPNAMSVARVKTIGLMIRRIRQEL